MSVDVSCLSYFINDLFFNETTEIDKKYFPKRAYGCFRSSYFSEIALNLYWLDFVCMTI